MVKVAFSCPEAGGFRLRLRGHAGAGAPGHDPVCAGVSTLAHTLAKAVALMEAAGLLAKGAKITLEPGRGEITAVATEDSWEITALAFWTAQVGFAALAEGFPENVALEEVMQVRSKR